jgi:hypothetical protein
MPVTLATIVASGFSRTVLLLVLAIAGCSTARTPPTAGFWFEDGAAALSADAAAKLGGPLRDHEIAAMAGVSRAEIDRAFSGLAIEITPNRDAFWRVQVLHTLARRGRKLPSAGESMALGAFGGSGAVDFNLVAAFALRYAPAGASRDVVLEAIGRGIGRVAVHEFAHQILGVAANVHDAADDHAYEYPSPERASQYYGELHWTIARERLHARLGSTATERSGAP